VIAKEKKTRPCFVLFFLVPYGNGSPPNPGVIYELDKHATEVSGTLIISPSLMSHLHPPVTNLGPYLTFIGVHN
jgi:hypothetical protein